MVKSLIRAFILFLLIPLSVFTQSKWTYQNPLPQGADMFAVFALSPNRTIITGSGGTIMTTEDAGQNWHIQRLPLVDIARKFSFISELEGWIMVDWLDIVGDSTISRDYKKIYKTNDGGITWQGLSMFIDIDFSTYNLNWIDFIDKQTGYLLANSKQVFPPEDPPKSGLIYRTVDGGIHWTQMDIGINRKYYQIIFKDSLTGFLLSQPNYSNFYFENALLHRTTDRGKTWTTFADSGFGLINFVSDSIGWAGNYKTTDGGETWNHQEFIFPELEHSIDKIGFADSLTGYAISYKTILKTVDGGHSWAIQTETKNGLLTDIQFYNSEIGFACGYGGTIFITKNGGESWIRYGEGVTENLEDVDFIDENTGWTVGYYGTILHTTNSGEVWEKQNIPAECDSTIFRGVDFLDNEEGWITGDEYILKTENSGNDWQINLKVDLVFDGLKGRFNDIKFLNENIGFAVGQKGLVPFAKGVIYQTIDGGINWQQMDDGNLSALQQIYFIDNDYGWVCGSGTLLYTSDGGENWHPNSFPGFLFYIQFTDREHGWVTSFSSVNDYRTTDGGMSWVQIPFENRYLQSLNSFFFFNNNQGITTTFPGGNILSTEDGGLNWSYEERLPTKRFNAITFVNDTLGWAVGWDGNILKFQGSYFDIVNSIDITNEPIPESFAGNYPNPFNGQTTIYFSLTKPQKVTLSIYNIMGESIETINFDDAIKGVNQIQWVPQNISSGLYFIRIHCLEFITTVQCLFIK